LAINKILILICPCFIVLFWCMLVGTSYVSGLIFLIYGV
jgi:hypothetical protein